MDLEIVEKMLYQKTTKARIKGKTTITYNLLLGILNQIEKLHKYNDMQVLYDSMYKSNIEMVEQIRDLKDQLRIANEKRAKAKIGKLEQKHERALKYIRKAVWLDNKEKNDLEEILREKYD